MLRSPRLISVRLGEIVAADSHQVQLDIFWLNIRGPYPCATAKRAVAVGTLLWRKRETQRLGPCVGFIYTPARANFESTLSGLGPSGLYGEHRSGRQCVDDLDTARLVGRSKPGSDPRQAPQL